MTIPIRFLFNLLTLATRCELADIYLFHFKLINYKIDSPYRLYLLKCILSNVLAYNNLSTFILYLPLHSTNYLTYSSITKAMSLCNILSIVQFFLYFIKA